MFGFMAPALLIGVVALASAGAYFTHVVASGATAKVTRQIERDNVVAAARRFANAQHQTKATNLSQAKVTEWLHQAQQMKRLFKTKGGRPCPKNCECSVDFSLLSR